MDPPGLASGAKPSGGERWGDCQRAIGEGVEGMERGGRAVEGGMKGRNGGEK